VPRQNAIGAKSGAVFNVHGRIVGCVETPTKQIPIPSPAVAASPRNPSSTYVAQIEPGERTAAQPPVVPALDSPAVPFQRDLALPRLYRNYIYSYPDCAGSEKTVWRWTQSSEIPCIREINRDFTCLAKLGLLSKMLSCRDLRRHRHSLDGRGTGNFNSGIREFNCLLRSCDGTCFAAVTNWASLFSPGPFGCF
jgi:hypothetical protein